MALRTDKQSSEADKPIGQTHLGDSLDDQPRSAHASPSGSPAFRKTAKLGSSSQPRTAHLENDYSPSSDPRAERTNGHQLGGSHPLEAAVTVEVETAAMQETQHSDRPGLAIFTDGSRLENGATG